ncbi:MAG: pyridoxal-phosphate dependent enzyme, partial [Actinomycetota bacterium]|nr:pyridoxal-phosphate dependent enzyme [Actinomycetota bacterium]
MTDHENQELTLDRVRAAEERLAGIAHRTPVLTSAALDAEVDGSVLLKAEMFQRGGSFKFRGAYSRMALLDLPERDRGVVAYSSGNHGGAVALAARLMGIPAVVVVPATGSAAKLAAIAGYGAELHTYDPAAERREEVAAAIAAERKLTIIRPFDDYDIMAGQGTVGLELLGQLGDRLSRVIVPVGGGGLASGVAIALKSQRPEIEVIGVQAEASAAFPASLARDEPVEVIPSRTIADGIAVKRPAELTLRLIRDWVDELAVVSEEAIAEAMIFLMERAKLVVEGAGAVGVAGLLGGGVSCAEHGVTAVILSGGNVDAGLLAQLARRHESEAGRRLVLLTRLPDSPGSLARLLSLLGASGANLLDVQHVREGIELY